MDSLLANYASDDDETDDERKASRPSAPPSKPSSFFSSLPPLKSTTSSSSSSLFSSLPPPKSRQPNPSPNTPIPSPLQTLNDNPSNQHQERKPSNDFPPPSSSSALFSSLPPPKSLPPNPKKSPPLDPNPKKIVQLTLPLNPSLLKSADPDADEDEEEKERKSSKDSSNSAAPRALSSMLPAPKNSLCLAPTAASRKSIVESSEVFKTKQERSDPERYGGPKAESFELEQEKGNFETYRGYPLEQGISSYENYGSYDGSLGVSSNYERGGGGGGGDYASYVENWADGSVTMVVVPEVPDVGRIVGKRARNEIPADIMEVKQDELIKNRPREDQVKLTGIAFGPSYQPVSTSKGKPSKLHKRKHQIGSLYYDMKQKEMELAERRAKGFLTKAETQAKYGW